MELLKAAFAGFDPGTWRALLCAGILILVGLDSKISSSRWKKGFKDLNPVVQFGVRNYGMTGGLAGLFALNLTLLILLSFSPMLLAILFGAKLGLATIQIRSLQINGKRARKS